MQRRVSICEYAPIELSALDNEALKRRYRRKYENAEKIKELMVEQFATVENLSTAIEGKMEIAVIGILMGLITSLETAGAALSSDALTNVSSSKSVVDGGDLQRALYRCDICPAIASALRELGGHVSVCERALQAVAFLCRYSDEVKTSVCLENAKGLGMAGVCELIVGAIKRHPEDKRIIEGACDAIRCLCSLESNRERLGNAGACEATVRALTTFSSAASNVETCCWICRAIGHLANTCETNREIMGGAGACETLIMTMQKFAFHMQLCTEACWAVRQIAPNENNRARLANDFGPESIVAVYKSHVASEAFATEACHALVNMLASEEDDLIPRIANAGLVQLALRSLKKCPNSETLSRWVFNALYYIACDSKYAPKLISSDVLDILSLQLEQHAGCEGMAEWSARMAHKLILQIDNASTKMRNAGLCEMICATVQRQAISSVVSSAGCLVIGDLAKDKSNHERLSSAGACEAVVGALKRHSDGMDVVVNTCYAIHFLSMTANNVSWMGAYGACEAVTNALISHHDKSPEAAKNACNAIGSLAFEDEGNQARFHAAQCCPAVVNALDTHIENHEVAEFACRALYNLTAEPLNLTAVGKRGCALVVTVLKTHMNRASVITQALLAIHSLSVKLKMDKVHNGNTKKLVAEGAIQVVVASMQKFADEENVQRAAAMAIASLARLPDNGEKLGECGACDLVVKSMKRHIAVESVVSKLALAIEALCKDSNVNAANLIALKSAELLLSAFQRHEKSATVVADAFRAFIILSGIPANKQYVHSENAFKLYIKAMKTHEKSPVVSRWGCNLIFCAAESADERKVAMLGNVKACDTVVNVMTKHGTKQTDAAEWACKALVALSSLPSNKAYFLTTEACTAVVASLQELHKDAIVAEWVAAALVTLSSSDPTHRMKLGSVGACAAVSVALSHHQHNSTIAYLLCNVVFELAREGVNRPLFISAGIIPTLTLIFTHHISEVALVTSLCRAIANLGYNNLDSSSQLCTAGIPGLIANGMKTHLFSPGYMQESCAAIYSLSTKNPMCQDSFGSFNVIDLMARALMAHKSGEKVVNQITRALRALTLGHSENQIKVAQSDIVVSAIILLKMHMNSDALVENLCWIVGTITYTGPDGVSVVMPRRRNSVTTRVEPEPSSDRVHPNPKDFYNDVSNWDILSAALRTHSQKAPQTRWICAALSAFGDRSTVAHLDTCDLLIACYQQHAREDNVLQRVVHAMGALAKCNKENNTKLTRLKACEVVEQLLADYTEGNVIIFGILPAISGLAKDSPDNQIRFHESPSLCRNVAKVLYNELESKLISQYGCSAVTSLVTACQKNQLKLSNVCTYVADIINAHKNDIEVLTEAFRMTSALSHDNITNRNKLGANDACYHVPVTLQNHFSNLIFNPLFDLKHSMLYWAVRAIGDLAANNPNNQSKLGAHGACECLLRILHREVNDGDAELEKHLFAVTFWAIGNMVNLAKGPEMMVDERHQSSKSLAGVGNFIPLPTKKHVKNSAKFMNGNVAEATVQATMRFIDEGSIVLWACRAITNLCKSYKLKVNFQQKGVNELLEVVFSRHANNTELLEWATMAKDTIQSQSSKAPLI